MSKATNLLDSLCIITSDNLLKDLIGELAPAFTYDWQETAYDVLARSYAIEEKLYDFQRQHPNQHCSLKTYLSTIALINADENGAYLKKQIHANPFLRKRKSEYDFGPLVEPDLTSNLAAWLLLQTHLLAPGTVEHDKAKKLWDEVVTIATKRGSKVRYRQYPICDPTVKDETDWDKNVNDKYLDYLRVVLMQRRINPKQPVPVGYIRQQEDHYFQFLFKIPKYPKLSSQVRQDGEGYEPRRDMNADSIAIQFYPNINIIKVSDEPDVDTDQIAKHFAEDVLGSRIDEKDKNKVYSAVLAQFASRDYIASLRNTLTQEAFEAKAEVWIEEMEFSCGTIVYDEEDAQATFKEITPATAREGAVKEFPPMAIRKCGPADDVYELLDRAFKDEFTADKRTILSLKLVVKLLNPVDWHATRSKGKKSEFTDYPITITDTKRTIKWPPATPSGHKQIIENLLQEWKLVGMPKAQILKSIR